MARRSRVKKSPVVGLGLCIDCLATGLVTRRPARRPGPRCATHARERKQKTRSDAHDKYVLETYGITGEEYWQIYDLQGGVCALCRRATGAGRRLSVDHDHGCCSGPLSCGLCVRSLLCRSCNVMLGHGRDDPDFFLRTARYLIDPPGKEFLNDKLYD